MTNKNAPHPCFFKRRTKSDMSHSRYHLHLSALHRAVISRKRTGTSACSSLCPITGAPAEFYSRPPGRFLLAATGLFSRSLAYGLHSSRPLSGCLADRYSSDQCLYAIQFFKRANKNALHPPTYLSWEGRRAALSYGICQDLVIPPSFAAILRRAASAGNLTMHLSPDYGGSRRVLLLVQIPVSSRGFRVFFTARRHMGFPPAAHSLHATKAVTRPCDACA